MDTDVEFFRNLEESLLQPEIRRSKQLVENLLADDFVEIGASGSVYDKKQVIEALASEEATERWAGDFTLRLLSDHLALVTYRARRRDANGELAHSLRSSIWQFNRATWRLLFHQGTPCR